MKQAKFLIWVAAFAVSLTVMWGQVVEAADYEKLKKVSDVVSVKPKQWSGGSTSLRVPMIAWGGDMQTIYANGMSRSSASDSHFAKAGLKVELYREDQFLKQVENYMQGRTPFLRGTMGMINLAAEVANKYPETEIVVIYQLTWSAGSDVIVVKDSITKPADLKGKQVAIQSFGPHIDYLTTILKSAGLSAGDVDWKWVPDLFEVDEKSFSPAMALTNDKTIDAAMVIMPDALILTSGGNTGNGAEGSVRGGRMLLSTKTADRVIADVYAVRKDFFKKHPGTVQKFVGALVEAEKETRRISKLKNSEWNKLLKSSAGMLLDDNNATDDMQQMFLEADFAGLAGNAQFFNDANYPRRGEVLNKEIQEAFVSLGLLSKTYKIDMSAVYFKDQMDPSDLAAPAPKRFDPEAVDRIISSRQSSDSLSKGELFAFEIYFQPNQKSFPPSLYNKEFDKAIELISTFGGALLAVEGHSDPIGYLKKKKDREPKTILDRFKQSAHNLSLSRANAVRTSLISYAQSNGIALDPSQFAVVGHGVMKPNTPTVGYDPDGDLSLQSAPRTKEQWDATRRVVFRIIQVEAEEEAFSPLF